MGEKGAKTREYIKEKSYELFAARGFKQVTMKDVCEATGLSRGGLYRHFDSTRTIFEEIFSELTRSAEDDTRQKMKAGMNARQILRRILEDYRREMDNSKRSLSFAMCEYSQAVSSNFFIELNQKGKARWRQFIEYGIERGEFRSTDPEQITDLILFSYQGVRMWSSIIPVDEGISRHVTACIWELLTGTEWEEQ